MLSNPSWPDMIFLLCDLALWSQVELITATVGANGPTLVALWRHLRKRSTSHGGGHNTSARTGHTHGRAVSGRGHHPLSSSPHDHEPSAGLASLHHYPPHVSSYTSSDDHDQKKILVTSEVELLQELTPPPHVLRSSRLGADAMKSV